MCDKCFNREKKRVKRQNLRKNSEGSLTVDEWLKRLEFFDFSCAVCKSKETFYTLDHIISLANGGKNKGENIQPLCTSCHEIKGTIETKLKGNKKKRLEALELKQQYDLTLNS